MIIAESWHHKYIVKEKKFIFNLIRLIIIIYTNILQVFDDLYENKNMLLTYKYASDFIGSLKMWCC